MEHGENMVIRDRKHAMSAFIRLVGKHRPVTRQDRLGVAEWSAYEHHKAGRRGLAARIYLGAAIAYRSPGNVPPAIGALFGERGMRLASRLLVALRGASHIERDPPSPPPEPAWLALYR